VRGSSVYSALAVDDTSIYWGVNDSIKSAPRGGGSAVTVASSLGTERTVGVRQAKPGEEEAM